MFMFKLLQLSGDLVDLAAFWLKICAKKTKIMENAIDKLEQL